MSLNESEWRSDFECVCIDLKGRVYQLKVVPDQGFLEIQEDCGIWGLKTFHD
jgi:hypothetical protein